MGIGGRQSDFIKVGGHQSWSPPGGLETACSRPALPYVTLTVPPDAQQLFFQCRTTTNQWPWRNITAASSHCVLTVSWTAFPFLSCYFHHFHPPLPPSPPPPPQPASASDSGHIYNQRFLFSRGNKLPSPAAASTGKSSGNRRRETQTVKIASNERSAPDLLPPLNCSAFSFLFPHACADIYADVFQVGAICKKK